MGTTASKPPIAKRQSMFFRPGDHTHALRRRQLVGEGMNAANFGDPFNWSDRSDPMAHDTPTAADDLDFFGGGGNAMSGRNADCVLPMSLMSVKGPAS